MISDLLSSGELRREEKTIEGPESSEEDTSGLGDGCVVMGSLEAMAGVEDSRIEA